MQDYNRDWLEGQALWLYKRQSRTKAKRGRTEKKHSALASIPQTIGRSILP